MNERIKELAKQAGIYPSPRRIDETPITDIGILTPHRKYVSDEEHIRDNFQVVRAVLDGYGLEKFAELIVKESMAMCDELKAQYLTSRKSTMDFDEKHIYAEGEAACDIIKYKMKKQFGVEE